MQLDRRAEESAVMTKLKAVIRKFAKVLKNVTKHHCIERVCKIFMIVYLFVFR